MKGNLLVLLLVMSLFFFTSCWKSEGEKQAGKVIDVMEQVSDVQNDMIELAEKSANWEISEEEYEREMDKLNELFDELEKNINESTEKMSENDIPSWAKKLGLRKINWLEFNLNESESLKEESAGWFDAVNMSYTSTDYDEVIKQAESLAKDLNITEYEMSPRKSMWSVMKNMENMWLTEKQMKEMQWNMDENMKWAMFVNCVLWMWCTEKYEYAKMISVEGEWKKWSLNISIVNIEQWRNEMEKHIVK